MHISLLLVACLVAACVAYAAAWAVTFAPQRRVSSLETPWPAAWKWLLVV